MKIAFFGTKDYDQTHFEEANHSHEITFFRPKLSEQTVVMAQGFDAVCVFVNDEVGTSVVEKLAAYGIKHILLRCAGFNNVDLAKAQELGITVARVPGYSPEAVAEHAISILMAANRRIPRAYNKVKNNDYSLNTLEGKNLFQKTAGIVGTGKIGQAMIRILRGFGMEILAYDPYPNEALAKELGYTYVSFEELLKASDVISLHCPLTKENTHLLNRETMSLMKDGVMLVNTSRGGLINTEALIDMIKQGKFHCVALDVYEEEGSTVFEDMSGEILEHTTTARLTSFPNVVLTSHQGFFTSEALQEIAKVTIQNADAME